MPALTISYYKNRLTKRLRLIERQPRIKRLKKIVASPRFGTIYVLVAVTVLLLSTLLWSILSSRVQQANADQLIDAYLFQHMSTLHGAIFPNQHTFLFKWPLFFIIKIFNFSPASFIAISVVSVIGTVAFLALILYKIDRRPLVFGTLLLALASVLIMTPTQPTPGALLPVNMAMVTTRNLEYVLYITGLYLLVRSSSLKNIRFWIAGLVLALLFASDKLFLDLGVAASFIALIICALRHRWSQVSLSVLWVVCTGIAAATAIVLIALIEITGIAHTSVNVGPGPYGFTHSLKDIILGSFYAMTGIFTNFGANPAYNANTLAQIPHAVIKNMSNVAALSYLTNIAILIFGGIISYRVWMSSFHQKMDKRSKTTAYRLAIMLIWTAFAAIVAFIVTNHYYVVDARYLSIVLFAVFIATASYGRFHKPHPLLLVVCGGLFMISVGTGAVTALHTYRVDSAAFLEVSQRNQRVAQVLSNHKVDVLTGDYWRVVPIKAVTNQKQTVLPLQSCTMPRELLTSKAWESDIHHHSFAYLLTLDTGLTGYQPCNLQQIINAYGRPNASALIAGTLAEPKELILYYDNGLHDQIQKGQTIPIPSTVLPISIDSLPNTSCFGPTVMNIVAHEDDDLLFMNPDLLHSIAAGDCVRTIYITAGDSGSSSGYWLSRERGSEAAYASMIGVSDVWIERIVSISSHEYITVANPKANTKISLLFMHLPDGGIHGDGFGASNQESLSKLFRNKIATIQSVDQQSSYTSSELTAALVSLLHVYQPAEVRAQSTMIGEQFPDHSDHISTGEFTDRAYNAYESQQYNNQVIIPLKHYIGYPIHAFEPNVADGDLQAKAAAFLAYSLFDGAVCNSIQQCSDTPTYGAYLTRQYLNQN